MAFAEWFEIAVHSMAGGDARVAEVARTPGTRRWQVCTAIAIAADDLDYRALTEIGGLFADTARGDRLSRLTADRFDVNRKGATTALVPVRFSRTGTTQGQVDAGTVLRTASGVRFVTDQDVPWGAGDTSDKAVGATALLPGPEGNVAAAAIVAIESAVFDGTITVTNDVAGAGGEAEESDEQLIDRYRRAFVTARRGTADAVLQGCLAVERVREAAVFEDLNSAGDPTGIGYAIISAQGDPTALVAEVVEELRAWRPIGVPVYVSGATVSYETIAGSAVWAPQTATAANVMALRQAIVARVNRLVARAAPAGAAVPVECLLTPDVLAEAAATLRDRGCLRFIPTTPAGTVEPGVGEILKTRLDLVTVS